MILIFGGAYQGKLAYAQKEFGENVKIINELEREILKWVQSGEDVAREIDKLIISYPDAVFICADISCGVVPTCPVERKWREETGRAMVKLASKSERVIRLYCGIPTIVK